jgi:predicted DNA-binding protein
MMDKTLSFQLPKQMYDALETLAKEDHRSKGFILRDIIQRYLEDYADIQMARKISKDIAEGREETVDFDTVMKKLSLE